METAGKNLFEQSLKRKIWSVSWILAVAIFNLFLIYAFFYYQQWSLAALGSAVAATAATMLGLSFSLSGIGYYFDFLDSKIIHRKYFGLIGFWLSLLYSVMLLFINPNRYFYGFFDNLGTGDFILGLSAMTIFAGMQIISNESIIRFLGPKLWRELLGLGYIAYALLIIRAILIEGPLWINWLHILDGLPPVRLLISLFAFGVILLRLSIPIHKALKASQPLPPAAPLGSQP